MARLNLSYYAPADIFYYTETDDISPEYKEDFLAFYEEVISKLNLLGGTYTVDTGNGIFPYHQTMKLRNFSADQILTNLSAGTSYDFDITVQGSQYLFSEDGANLTTYRDVINVILANTAGCTVEYFPSTNVIDHRFRFTSGTVAVGPTPGPSVTSSISVAELFGVALTGSDSTNTDGQQASFLLTLPEHNGYDVLTKVPNNGDAVFKFKQGTDKGLAVAGSDAQTYGQLVDSIDTNFSTINCDYRMDAGYRHEIILHAPLAVTQAEIDAFPYIANGIKIMPAVTDFSPLVANGNEILHLLENPIAGGTDMLGVIAYSKRANGNSWNETIPITSSDANAEEVVAAGDPDQAAIIEATEDTPSEFAIGVSSLDKSAGPVNGGLESPKSATTPHLVNQVPTDVDLYKDKRDGNVAVPDIEAPLDAAGDTVVNDGYAPGALDGSGNVLDENLLTDAQKSAKVTPPDTFGN